MNQITQRIWYNIRPTSLLLGIGAVLAGLAASVLRGGVVLFPALMSLLCAVLFQMSANLYYGYRKAKHIVENDAVRMRRIDDPDGYFLMRIISNVCAILAITMAMPLFMRLRWISLVYLALILGIVYFHFSGPHPLVKTRWSVLVTFILFGPIAVSGTALIQNLYNTDMTPILVYSAISGLLAVNTHLAIQYLRKAADIKDGMETLLESKGTNMVRHLYLINSLAVCIIFTVFSGDLGFESRFVGVALSILLLCTSIAVCLLMRREDTGTALKIRLFVIVQYVAVMVTLLCIVLVSMQSYWVTFLTIR